jgi:hypothetical protein
VCPHHKRPLDGRKRRLHSQIYQSFQKGMNFVQINTHTIVEMDVDWNVREDVRFDYYTYAS